MDNNGFNLKEIITLLRRRLWLVFAFIVLGGCLGGGWRWWHPIPVEASVQLPVVIRNRDDSQLWDELRADAMYHSVYQVIVEAGIHEPQLVKNAWLTLTEETFILTVRHQNADIAEQLVAQWAGDAYQTLTGLASQTTESPALSILAVCIERDSRRTEYTCNLVDALGGGTSSENHNNAYISLWIGEPEGFKVQDSSSFSDGVTAFVSGGLIGLIASFLLIFLRLATRGTQDED